MSLTALKPYFEAVSSLAPKSDAILLHGESLAHAMITRQ